jgi:hypothetical protein
VSPAQARVFVSDSAVNPDKPETPEYIQNGAAFGIFKTSFGEQFLLSDRRIKNSIFRIFEIAPICPSVEVGNKNIRID